MNSVSDVLTAVKIVMDLSKEVDEWLSRFKSVKYLIEIELRSVPGDAEDVRTFVGRMLEEMGCGEEGDCVFMGARLRAAAFVYSAKLAEEAAHLLGEEELPDEDPDAADVLLVVGVQRAKPGAVYELIGRIAEKAESIGVVPVVQISVFGNRKALKKLQRRLGDVKSKLLNDRLVLYPTVRQWLDRDLYRRLFGGLLAELLRCPETFCGLISEVAGRDGTAGGTVAASTATAEKRRE